MNDKDKKRPKNHRHFLFPPPEPTPPLWLINGDFPPPLNYPKIKNNKSKDNKVLVSIITHQKSKYPISAMFEKWIPKQKSILRNITNGVIDNFLFVIENDDVSTQESVSKSTNKKSNRNNEENKNYGKINAIYKNNEEILKPKQNNDDLNIYEYLLEYVDISDIERSVLQHKEWFYANTNPFKEISKLMKLKASFDYFLLNTDLAWLKYQDDDAYLYFPNFLKLIKQMNLLYNPYEEIVIKGCCTIDGDDVYLQGGTGLLMSRKACEFFVDNWNPFFYHANNFEDRSIAKLIELTNISWGNLSSSFFIGDPFLKREKKIIEKRKFSKIRNCPMLPPETKCGKEFHQLNLVASIHKVDGMNPSLGEIVRKGIPDNVMFFGNIYNRPRLCIKRNLKYNYLGIFIDFFNILFMG